MESATQVQTVPMPVGNAFTIQLVFRVEIIESTSQQVLCLLPNSAEPVHATHAIQTCHGNKLIDHVRSRHLKYHFISV